jgi:hypothetical protein
MLEPIALWVGMMKEITAPPCAMVRTPQPAARPFINVDAAKVPHASNGDGGGASAHEHHQTNVQRIRARRRWEHAPASSLRFPRPILADRDNGFAIDAE